MKTFTTISSRLLSATALCALLAVTAPAFAQDNTQDLNAQELSKVDNSTPEMGHPHNKDVESRIQKLHDQLKITPDEESKWADVANVMRDNSESMKQAFEDRKNKTHMTAVEDMESYHSLIAAHAESLQKLIDAFKPLYSAMSSEQKKNADHVFGHMENKQQHDKQSEKQPAR